MISFKYFRPLLLFSSTFWAGLGADHTVFHRNWESIFDNCVPNGFYCPLKTTSAKRILQTYGECSHFSIFSRQGYFPEVSRQVKEWLITEAHKKTNVTHAVACAMVFIVLCDRGWQGGVLKLMKNDHF